MLGADLAEKAKASGYNPRVFDLPEFDITRPDHLSAALANADYAVNCAAFTNVDMAEDKPELACAVNALALERLGKMCMEREIHLTHISTDFVFDGESALPYAEGDAPNPICVYGASKLAGEQALSESGAKAAIMRVQWSYGKNGVNFVTKLLERAKNNTELKVVSDQIGSPTWTADMAEAILKLVREKHTGLYHFANAGHASRHEVACFIIKTLNMSNKVKPCSSDEFPMKAKRPKNSCFNTSRIQAILGKPIRSWQAALAEFLSKVGT